MDFPSKKHFPGWTAGPERGRIAPMSDADVIIAGAGMAGATLALALARAGLTPLLVDPAPFEAQVAPTFDGRASAIAYANFRQPRFKPNRYCGKQVPLVTILLIIYKL